MEQLDQFIGYLFTIEENNAPLTQSQFDKLKSIQGKVTDLVNKMQSAQVQANHQVADIKQPVAQPQLELQLAETRVQRFAEYTKVTEKKRIN